MDGCPGPSRLRLWLRWAGGAAGVLNLVDLDQGLTVVARLTSLFRSHLLTPAVVVDTWRLYAEHVVPSMGAGAAAMAFMFLG